MRLLRNFWKGEGGATLPLIALAALALIGATGIAVDVSRKELAQAKLSNALDAAGLAAGSTVHTADLTAEATKYLNANYPSQFLGSTITQLQVTTNNNSTIIRLNAQGTMPTAFGKIFGINQMAIAADSEITREAKGLELVLVMDTTGSMADNNKLEDMKTAARTLMSILYGDRDTIENLWVGLVPFSQAVNVGPSRTGWLDSSHYAGLNWGPTSWVGCVDARYTGRDITDDPPSSERFRAYYWPDHNNYNDWRRSDGTYRSITDERGPNKYCPEPLTPMVASKTTVLNGITAMEARGNTHVNLGAVWGWRMLSPRWRGLWGGEMDANNLPLDYNAPLMNKAIIILTDGMNTMSDSVRSAYGYLSDQRLGTANASSAVNALNSRLASVCESMKAGGIIVYTIAFDNPGSSVENLLRNCASETDFYFDSPGGSDLQQAFRTIGDSLANLRISK